MSGGSRRNGFVMLYRRGVGCALGTAGTPVPPGTAGAGLLGVVGVILLRRGWLLLAGKFGRPAFRCLDCRRSAFRCRSRLTKVGEGLREAVKCQGRCVRLIIVVRNERKHHLLAAECQHRGRAAVGVRFGLPNRSRHRSRRLPARGS
ncbi:hypothetical protein AHiyo4_28070 [Arthrobacter sp. Hiyo4]|nr:hypothetical protein AHiyo4_28070 [Arthrobacter sp. Hiyo4]